MKEIEYKIASTKGISNDDSSDELEDIVSDMIQDGYTPIGGVAVRVGATRGAYLMQAMVRNHNIKDI